MQVSEFGVRHWVKRLYDRGYYQELHLKGSLAMLIRGLQNLFVTRSYAFSTKMLERNSSLVFVPVRTLLFLLFSFCPLCGFSWRLMSSFNWEFHSFLLFEWFHSFLLFEWLLWRLVAIHSIDSAYSFCQSIADSWSSLTGWLRKRFPTLTQRWNRF